MYGKSYDGVTGLIGANKQPAGLAAVASQEPVYDLYERAWLGPWEHVRGNERGDSGRLKMGRAGWLDEVMRFYDRFLKGTTPAVADPQIAVQTNDGRWRAEKSWPPADAKPFTTALRTGSYTDDGTANATGDGAEKGVWTISQPLTKAVHLSGIQGDPGTQLAGYLADTVSVPQGTIDASQSAFATP